MGNAESSAPATVPDGPVGEGAWEVQLATTEIIRMAGVAAYHTSVLVGGREYYFDNKGIATGPTLFSHTLGRPSALKTEVVRIGRSLHSGATMSQALSQFFTKGTYDILHKNCNAFTDAALYFLTRTRLDRQYSRAERILLAMEPLSASVLNQMLKAASEATAAKNAAQGKPPTAGVRGYSVNPQARGFCVEDVVAALNDADDDESVPPAGPGFSRRANSSFFGLAASCCCVLGGQSKSTELVPMPPELRSASQGPAPTDALDAEDEETCPCPLGHTVSRHQGAAKDLQVLVQRLSPEDKLGIELKPRSGQLAIVNIVPGSAVDRANAVARVRTPPGDTLQVGDVITQVNGVNDVNEALVTECQQSLDLKFRALRQVPLSVDRRVSYFAHVKD